MMGARIVWVPLSSHRFRQHASRGWMNSRVALRFNMSSRVEQPGGERLVRIMSCVGQARGDSTR